MNHFSGFGPVKVPGSQWTGAPKTVRNPTSN
jgi:hypothetical protein